MQLPIRILHISDVHIRGDNQIRDRVLLAFIESIEGLGERFGHPDLVVMTGDLAFSGKKEEYERCSAFFDDLLAKLSLPKSRLIVIPGNHDVDRVEGHDLLRSLDSEQSSVDYFGRGYPLRHIVDRKRAYIAWHDTYFASVRTVPVRSSVSDPEIVEISGKRLAIVRADTATFSLDDTDYGKLWIGRRSFEKCMTVLKTEKYDTAVLLTHHPLDWLSDIEKPQIRAVVRENFDLQLHGHLHTPDFDSAISTSGELCTIAAGALYESETFPKTSSLISIYDDRFEVAPYLYSDSPRPQWTIDPSFFPDEPHYVGKLRRGVALALPLPTSSEVDASEVAFSSFEQSREYEQDLFEAPNGQLLYVEPRLRSVAPDSHQSDPDEHLIELASVVASDKSYLVKSRSEYGSTTLAKRIVSDLGKLNRRAVYRDARNLPNYRQKLGKNLSTQGISSTSLGELVIDNFDFDRDEKLLKELASLKCLSRVIIVHQERGVRADVTAEAASLPFTPTPIFLWPMARHDIRTLAMRMFDTSDQTVISEVVDKVYVDLLDLRIPLTPVTVVMYLKVIHRDGSYDPLNRVDIMERFLREA